MDVYLHGLMWLSKCSVDISLSELVPFMYAHVGIVCALIVKISQKRTDRYVGQNDTGTPVDEQIVFL